MFVLRANRRPARGRLASEVIAREVDFDKARSALSGRQMSSNRDPYCRPVVRYTQGDVQNYDTVTAMRYSGKWNSTDQVPQRAIVERLIDRFGSLNPHGWRHIEPLQLVVQPRGESHVELHWRIVQSTT
jgi:hypothetical protein